MYGRDSIYKPETSCNFTLYLAENLLEAAQQPTHLRKTLIAAG